MNATEYLKHWKRKKVWKRLEVAVHQNRFRKISSFLTGRTFIDVGCAYGHSTHHLKKMTGGSWTGIEFDADAAIKARGLFPDIPFIYLSDTDKIQTLSPFDGVVCSEVIEHVEHDQRLVDNLVAITGKTLVVTTPCAEVDDPGHLRLYTEEALSGLFKKHGPVECVKTSRFFYIVFKRGAK